MDDGASTVAENRISVFCRRAKNLLRTNNVGRCLRALMGFTCWRGVNRVLKHGPDLTRSHLWMCLRM